VLGGTPEVQTIAAARTLAGKRWFLIGVGRPSTAAMLARMVDNPDPVLVHESGATRQPTGAELSALRDRVARG